MLQAPLCHLQLGIPWDEIILHLCQAVCPFPKQEGSEKIVLKGIARVCMQRAF